MNENQIKGKEDPVLLTLSFVCTTGFCAVVQH